MSFLNIELKARTNKTASIRNWLLQNGAEFRGTDNQTDTYFNVDEGRLKLRDGNIENNLIYYRRADNAGPKPSEFELMEVKDSKTLKTMLTQAIGIRVVVKKKREIYFIGNVKFHLDELPGLGSFVEIEASNLYEDLTQGQLQEQCDYYRQRFEIKDEDLVAGSYSDMIVNISS